MLQGPTNPLALRRTFGKSGEPEVKLYRCARVLLERSQAALCILVSVVNFREPCVTGEACVTGKINLILPIGLTSSPGVVQGQRSLVPIL